MEETIMGTIEFVGLPGSGKTTWAAELQEIFAGWENTGGIGIPRRSCGLGYGKRSIQKIWNLLLNPCLLVFFLTCRSRDAFIRFNKLLNQVVIRRRRRNISLSIDDQSLAQYAWAYFAVEQSARARNCVAEFILKLYRKNDCIIYVETDADIAAERLKKRVEEGKHNVTSYDNHELTTLKEILNKDKIIMDEWIYGLKRKGITILCLDGNRKPCVVKKDLMALSREIDMITKRQC